MMKKTGKFIVVSVILAVIITAFSLLLIAYDKGLFDLSFIKRAENDDPVTTSAPQTEPEDTTAPETSGDTDTTVPDSDSVSEDTQPTPTPGIFDEIHGKYGTVGVGDKEAAERTYDPENMTLYRLEGIDLPSEEFYFDLMSRQRYRVSESGEISGLRVFTQYTSHEFRRAVDIYMGMIVVSDGKTLTFYDGKGSFLYKYEGEEELVFAYERDLSDRPLFILSEQYYYIDAETHELAESDYDARDSRGLYYNYPSDFGRFEGQYRSFRSGNYHGIMTAEEKTVRTAIFEEGYNYNDGLGLISYKGDACYMNEAGKVAIDDFEIVVQRDEGGIGSIYFDGGYVMTRKIKYHPRNDHVVEEDEDVLIDKKGREFELPVGYKAVSYSDQRVLVKKDGKYGFYAVKGAWTADAVYDHATPFYEGLAVVGIGDKKGVIDLDGNFVIPLSYQSISVCSGGITVCYSADTGYEIYIKA